MAFIFSLRLPFMAKTRLQKSDGGSRSTTILSTVSLRIVTNENRGLPGRRTVKVGQWHHALAFHSVSYATFVSSPCLSRDSSPVSRKPLVCVVGDSFVHWASQVASFSSCGVALLDAVDVEWMGCRGLRIGTFSQLLLERWTADQRSPQCIIIHVGSNDLDILPKKGFI